MYTKYLGVVFKAVYLQKIFVSNAISFQDLCNQDSPQLPFTYYLRIDITYSER